VPTGCTCPGIAPPHATDLSVGSGPPVEPEDDSGISCGEPLACSAACFSSASPRSATWPRPPARSPGVT